MPTRGRKQKFEPTALVTDYLIRNLPADAVARIHNCSAKTVHRAVKAVEKLDTPEAATIRRLAAIRH
jgi:hypothetical protein